VPVHTDNIRCILTTWILTSGIWGSCLIMKSAGAGAYRQHSVHTANMDFDLWYLRFLFKSWYISLGSWGSSSSPYSLAGEEYNSTWNKRIHDEMLAIHCWISEGQSKCDEWGSARICCQDPFSVHKRKDVAQNKERADKTWQGVTFCETCSPFQMGAKTWNIDGSPSVKNRAGVNPITMDCKMNECYSVPHKSHYLGQIGLLD